MAVLASCSNDNPGTAAAETKVITPTDTAGLAQFQTWKTQNELATTTPPVQQNIVAPTQPVKEVVKERVVYVDKPVARKKTITTRRSDSSTANSSV